MKLPELKKALLKLGPEFKLKPSSDIPDTADAFAVQVDDVDFSVIADGPDTDSAGVTVCCVFGEVPAPDTQAVLLRAMGLNWQLAKQGAKAACWLPDLDESDDLFYVFSTDVNEKVVPELANVMGSVAKQALIYQQTH